MIRPAALLLPILVAGWAVAVADGAGRLWDYSAAPGVASVAPERLPAGIAAAPAGGYRLLAFFHPRCPCSRASVRELAEVLSDADVPVDATAHFLVPAGEAPDWAETGLWRSAVAVPGLRSAADPGGATAGRFGVATSGAVLLYDARGRLAFSGGVTAGRGHEGDSPGNLALRAVLTGDSAASARPSEAAVFGCGLRPPADARHENCPSPHSGRRTGV